MQVSISKLLFFFVLIEETGIQYCDFLLQLQLQHNEVIALLNLLNRLSESIKLVHEMGPAVEKAVGVPIPAFGDRTSTWQKLWNSVTTSK